RRLLRGGRCRGRRLGRVGDGRLPHPAAQACRSGNARRHPPLRAGAIRARDRTSEGKSVTSVPNESAKVCRRRIAVLLPLAVFLALVLLFLLRLYSGDPSLIPSALIGNPAPQTNLPPVAGLERDGAPVPGIDPANFK